jgi:formylglycine-generating enzyme required for sulfatase activity
MPLPEPPFWQLTEAFEPRATSARGVVPNGYLSGNVAAQACRNAGKRLCLTEEWVTACRGFQGRKYPYGDEYRPGACNVFRETHPAAKLHDDASRGHHDPRLNQVDEAGEPLLRVTGATATCRSEWGSDAAYDMVGNLDEWVDEPAGAFVGGFYARGTKEGCDARITSHPPQYFDYSLGVRCCR